jgi:hypothetical protein
MKKCICKSSHFNKFCKGEQYNYLRFDNCIRVYHNKVGEFDVIMGVSHFDKHFIDIKVLRKDKLISLNEKPRPLNYYDRNFSVGDWIVSKYDVIDPVSGEVLFKEYKQYKIISFYFGCLYEVKGENDEHAYRVDWLKDTFYTKKQFRKFKLRILSESRL